MYNKIIMNNNIIILNLPWTCFLIMYYMPYIWLFQYALNFLFPAFLFLYDLYEYYFIAQKHQCSSGPC